MASLLSDGFSDKANTKPFHTDQTHPCEIRPLVQMMRMCVCVYHRDREIENMCTCECVSACARVCACAGVLQYDKCVPPHNLCVSKYDVCEYEL